MSQILEVPVKDGGTGAIVLEDRLCIVRRMGRATAYDARAAELELEHEAPRESDYESILRTLEGGPIDLVHLKAVVQAELRAFARRRQGVYTYCPGCGRGHWHPGNCSALVADVEAFRAAGAAAGQVGTS